MKPLPNSAMSRAEGASIRYAPYLGTILTALLFFHDLASDLPVGPDHGGVDHLECLIAGLGEDAADTTQGLGALGNRLLMR